ncbi:hypothetical protein GGI22_008076, partial [Coemansia erecta]
MQQQPYTAVPGGRTRRKSSVTMNVDTPPSKERQQQTYQDLGTFQNSQQYPQVQGDYYPYATTTVQMVDPWAFNHANLLANLSQLPPELLPSIMQQANQHNSTHNMSALAAAAAAAAVAANQQIPQPQMHVADNSNHSFAVPGSVMHGPHHHQPQQQYQNQQYGSNAMLNSDINTGGGGNSNSNSNIILPSISTLP